jgi:hypothetical protein
MIFSDIMNRSAEFRTAHFQADDRLAVPMAISFCYEWPDCIPFLEELKVLVDPLHRAMSHVVAGDHRATYCRKGFQPILYQFVKEGACTRLVSSNALFSPNALGKEGLDGLPSPPGKSIEIRLWIGIQGFLRNIRPPHPQRNTPLGGPQLAVHGMREASGLSLQPLGCKLWRIGFSCIFQVFPAFTYTPSKCQNIRDASTFRLQLPFYCGCDFVILLIHGHDPPSVMDSIECKSMPVNENTHHSGSIWSNAALFCGITGSLRIFQGCAYRTKYEISHFARSDSAR